MDIWKKISKALSREKSVDSVTATGGLELLSKLTQTETTGKNFLHQYEKSLYVFACVSKIAEKVASVDLELYRVKNSKGDTSEITSHPILDLLYRPNPFQTKTEFLETTLINLKTTGDAFWFKVRNNQGRPVELWNLRPDYVTIKTDPVNFIREYEFDKQDGTISHFAPEDIVHFKYANPLNQYTGLSPIKPAQMRVETEHNSVKYQRDFFLNSARPDALIKNPENKLNAEQKSDLREGWNKLYRGPGNSSKVAVLSGGLEYQQISLSQREMDYIETLKFTRDDILVAFKVPKPIVAIVDDVNRANSETAMFIFLSETIVPEMKRLVEKINEELVTPDFGAEFVMDFEDPTPENRELLIKEYETGIKNNYLLINEVRQWEGLPPITGGWSIYMPIINQAVGGLSKSETKDLMEVIKSDSDNNELAATEKPGKTISFKGKYWLQKKLEMTESITMGIAKGLQAMKAKTANKKKSKSKAKAFVSILKEAETKKAWAEMVNKAIDKKTNHLKEEMTGFAMQQKERVLNELGREKALTTKAITASDIFDTKKEMAMTVEFITPFIEAFLKESGKESLTAIAPQEDFQETTRIQKLIEKRAKEFAESVGSTTLEKLGSAIDEGIANAEGINELTARVNEVFDQFPTYRSALIARTEATAANNEGMLEGFRQSGIANGKEWINAGDGSVRAEHADGSGVGGEIVGLNKNFSNGLGYPQEPNCRCVLGPAFIE